MAMFMVQAWVPLHMATQVWFAVTVKSPFRVMPRWDKAFMAVARKLRWANMKSLMGYLKHRCGEENVLSLSKAMLKLVLTI